MTPELKHALRRALTSINRQSAEAGIGPDSDFEADGEICEDGETLLIHVEAGGHVFTASIEGFTSMLQRAAVRH